ncbi:hypothetical protein XENOCAPTIV_001907, partial [Xenoophorus captivus]
KELIKIKHKNSQVSAYQINIIKVSQKDLCAQTSLTVTATATINKNSPSVFSKLAVQLRYLFVPVLQERKQSQVFLKFSMSLFSLANICSYDTVSNINSNQLLTFGTDVDFHSLRITLAAATTPTRITVFWCFDILGITVWSPNKHNLGDMGIATPIHFPI